MKIEIEKYNTAWPDAFLIEKEALLKVLAPANPVIEHIGSTAVEGLSAIPVIDIMIGLPNFKVAHQLVTPLKRLGYKHIAKYEEQMPDRMFFLKSSGGERSHHVNIVQLNEDFWDRHMFFRDHLRRHEKTRTAYQHLKTRLSKLAWEDRKQYALAKAAFIRAIEQKYF
ncbi:MAG: GrpB family protein [Flavobacteriales bacterium]|nr:GrpB family protein [Flavobacteriales bacterium]